MKIGGDLLASANWLREFVAEIGGNILDSSEIAKSIPAELLDGAVIGVDVSSHAPDSISFEHGKTAAGARGRDQVFFGRAGTPALGEGDAALFALAEFHRLSRAMMGALRRVGATVAAAFPLDGRCAYKPPRLVRP